MTTAQGLEKKREMKLKNIPLHSTQFLSTEGREAVLTVIYKNEICMAIDPQGSNKSNLVLVFSM